VAGIGEKGIQKTEKRKISLHWPRTLEHAYFCSSDLKRSTATRSHGALPTSNLIKALQTLNLKRSPEVPMALSLSAI
jgi:hypothetical protein